MSPTKRVSLQVQEFWLETMRLGEVFHVNLHENITYNIKNFLTTYDEIVGGPC